jgi:hypothetical protein
MVANHFSIAILKSFNPVILNRYRSIQLTLMVANQVSIPIQKPFNPVISNGYWSIWLTFIVANHNTYFILFNYLINSHYLCHIHQHDWNKTKWELIKLSCLQSTKYLPEIWFCQAPPPRYPTLKFFSILTGYPISYCLVET